MVDREEKTLNEELKTESKSKGFIKYSKSKLKMSITSTFYTVTLFLLRKVMDTKACSTLLLQKRKNTEIIRFDQLLA